MNYEDIVNELDDVIKSSEKTAVEVLEKVESALSFTKDEKSSNLLLEAMNLIQQEDLLRQKLERVVNSICEVQNIDVSRFNIAPSAKHITGDDYDEMSQEDIDNMFQSNK